MITSLRLAFGWRVAALGALGLLLAGCAAPTSAPQLSAAPGAAAPLYATVAAVRPVPAAAAQTEGQLLASLGQPQAAGSGAGRSEVLVRTDDGQVLSVLASSTAGFAPGGRVVVLPGSPMRLGRPGLTPAPAS